MHTGPHQTERNTYAAPGRTEYCRSHWAAPDRTEHRRAYQATPDRTEDLHVCRTERKGRPPCMPPQAERKNAAHAALSRTEDRRTYRRLHWTGRKTATHEESLPRIPQATLGRKEDDNDDATPGIKKDDNHAATPSMKEDEHEE